MARLTTIGFETGSAQAEFGASLTGAGLSFSPAAARSGNYGLRGDGAQQQFAPIPVTQVNGASTYYRFYLRMPAPPPAQVNIFQPRNATPTTVNTELYVSASGLLSGWNGNAASPNSKNVCDGYWHRIELRALTRASGTNTVENEIWVDGVQLWNNATGTGNGAAVVAWLGMLAGSANSGTYDFDDFAINDTAVGGTQTAFPGEGSITILKAVSDNARSTGMTGGAGGTTNLWDAVNNTPPVGVINASATNTSQIHDSANNATDNYDANVQSYDAAGIGPSDSITLVQAIGRGGNSTTTSTNFGVNNVSNPGAGTELTVAAGTTATATDPTGWTTGKNLPTYAPSVVKTTQPVVRFGKRTASTNVIQCDFLGLQVEYVPQV